MLLAILWEILEVALAPQPAMAPGNGFRWAELSVPKGGKTGFRLLRRRRRESTSPYPGFAHRRS